MSFIDQMPRVATAEECQMNWGGAKKGERFRCYLCGHRFKPGDGWRWVYDGTHINFLTCSACDGPDVKERWHNINEEFYKSDKFWALRTMD